MSVRSARGSSLEFRRKRDRLRSGLPTGWCQAIRVPPPYVSVSNGEQSAAAVPNPCSPPAIFFGCLSHQHDA